MLAAILAMAWSVAWGHDFSAVAPSGQTLYYRFTGGGVEVTYPGATTSPARGWVGFSRPAGTVTVPRAVSHGGTTYDVVAVGGHAFYGCTGIEGVRVEDGVRAVRSNAFNGCTGLRKVWLPSTTDSVGVSCFAHCTAMDTFAVRRAVPPVCPASAFNDVPVGSAVLAVACGSGAAYSAAQPWSLFTHVVDTVCDVHLTVLPNRAARGSTTGGGTYGMGTVVQLTATPAEGCLFACWLPDGDTLATRSVLATADASYTALFFDKQHDTVWVNDTVHAGGEMVWRTLRVESGDAWRGIVAGSALVPEGTVIEVAAIALEGSAFAGWSDGVADNPRRVRVETDTVLTALFVPTAGGLDAGVAEWFTVHAEERRLTIGCLPGARVRVYTAGGRTLCDCVSGGPSCTATVPSAGVYVVRVGDGPGRKVVVE